MLNGGLRISVKTYKYIPSKTHKISVIRHVEDPRELFPASEGDAEDGNGIFCESVNGYLCIPTPDWDVISCLGE